MSALAFVALILAPHDGFADRHWNTAVSQGSWNTASNWIEGSLPSSTDNVYIVFNDWYSKTINYNGAYSSDLMVQIRSTDGGVVTLSLAADYALQAGWLDAGGAGGSGVVNQSAGTVTVSRLLHLGQGATGRGTYYLSGGSLSVSGSGTESLGEFIGIAGLGTLSQTGGTHTAAVPIFLGFATSGAGTYVLGGGVLNTNSSELNIGYDGSGWFVQSGGTHSIASMTNLNLGAHSGAYGNYNLQAGTLTVEGQEYVGKLGTGSFIQSGGTHRVGTSAAPRDLYVGYDPGSAGAYRLSHSALLNVTGHEYIGFGGIGYGDAVSGAFDQSGGTHTIGSVSAPRDLYVAYSQTHPTDPTTGVYLLSSGRLNVRGDEYIGYGLRTAGTFNQSGGTHTIGSGTTTGALWVGYSGDGTYLLSSGTLNLTGGQVVGGIRSRGLFDHSGGTNNVGTLGASWGNLRVGCYWIGGSGAGTYLLSGSATLNVSGDEYVGGEEAAATGVFSQSGGTHNVGHRLFVGGYSATGRGAGTLLLSGSGALNVTEAEFVGHVGPGTFGQSGGTNTTASLTVGYADCGTYMLSGGTLIVDSGWVTVADVGTGFFDQSGGTHLTRGLQFGREVGANGTYVLSGGTLEVNGIGQEHIGIHGTGVFAQSGGTHIIGEDPALRELFIGDYEGSAGTYLLSGGTLRLTRGAVRVGVGGTGVLEQTGGSLIIGRDDAGYQSWGSLHVAETSSGTGTCTLNHPTARFLVASDAYIGGSATAAGGSGVLNLLAGSMSLAGSMKVWNNAGSAINLAGAALTVADLDTDGDPARFNWTAGTLAVTGPGGLAVGPVGPIGTSLVLDTTRILVVSNTLTIASGGSVSLFGGTLSIGSLDAGGEPPPFHWTAGTLILGADLPISSSGPLGANLLIDAGKGLLVSGTEYAGRSDVGMVDQSGGTHVIGTAVSPTNLYIGSGAGGSGNYLLSGDGLLNVTGGVGVGGDLSTAGGTGVFSISGGTATVAGMMMVHPNGTVQCNGGALSVGPLTINAGGRVLLGTGGDTVLRTRGLSIAAGGSLDLTDNDMIIDYTGGSPLSEVLAQIQIGYATGAWTGSGITSSSADKFHHALGYGEASALKITSFDGISLDDTTVLVKFTYYGDATLDGQVDIADLGALATNWQRSTGVWTSGDFNYDGFIDIADLGLLATNWQAGVGNPLGPSLNDALASPGGQSVSVPEPTVLSLLALLIYVGSRRSLQG